MSSDILRVESITEDYIVKLLHDPKIFLQKE